MKKQDPAPNQPLPPLSAHVITEKLARKRFGDLLEAEHRLGSRQPKGKTLYQVVCRAERWIGLSLWTAALWHFKSRDQRLGWDPVMRSERLQLLVHQSRFLVLEAEREPNLASQLLALMTRELPRQWEECFGYRPLLAETFTDPESHHGTCYKAAGWEPVGFSRRDGRHYAEKLSEPPSSKKMWIKPLLANALELLVTPELPEAFQGGLAAHAGERLPVQAKQLGSLFDALQKIPDPRSRKARQFPLGAVLSLVVLGLLRGQAHLNPIVRQSTRLSQAQRRTLRLPMKKGGKFRRVPGYDVFREVLRRMDLEALARTLTEWMQSHAGELPRNLAIDGKTIRERLGLVVTLVDTETGAPVAVSADIRGKGHELKLSQQLLASDAVNLRGAVITADSLHCQDQSAHSITREKGGDYILQVRANQPTLEKYARQQLAEAPPLFLPRTASMDVSMSEP